MYINELRVNSYDDWEVICKYLANIYTSNKYGLNVHFSGYGDRGQKQHGIDLIPNIQDPAVVIQCKNTQSLTMSDVLSELNKTNGYPNQIDDYVVFTTASKHKSIQDYLLQYGNEFTRGNGHTFQFRVEYWNEIPALKILPKDVIEAYFPSVHNYTVQMQSNIPSYADSLRKAKNIIPKYISLLDLEWLNNWDFNKGYIIESDYEPFIGTYEKYGYAKDAKSYQIESFLQKDGVLDLIDTLIGAEQFYIALERFYQSIRGCMNSSQLSDGTRVLILGGLKNKHIYLSEIKAAANEVIIAYRQVIIGE